MKKVFYYFSLFLFLLCGCQINDNKLPLFEVDEKETNKDILLVKDTVWNYPGQINLILIVNSSYEITIPYDTGLFLYYEKNGIWEKKPLPFEILGIAIIAQKDIPANENLIKPLYLNQQSEPDRLLTISPDDSLIKKQRLVVISVRKSSIHYSKEVIVFIKGEIKNVGEDFSKMVGSYLLIDID